MKSQCFDEKVGSVGFYIRGKGGEGGGGGDVIVGSVANS